MSIAATNYDWEMRTQQFLASKSNNNSGSAYVSNNDASIFDGQQASVSTETGNTCTDGKDDGKIGFFGAIGSAVKGAVKGVVNGVKSCFTNKEGKFSLGKTLLTVGAAAACIAFPAVGVAACAVGVATGGAKVIGGAVKASNATTDAEAKDAWESIGDGACTAVTSAVGMKASIGAVKASSTSAIDDVAKAAGQAIDKGDDVASALKGLDNADDVANAVKGLDNADDVVKTVKTMGEMKETSALGNLDDGAKAMDKLKALGKDSLSSTKNNFGNLKTKAAVAKEVAEYKKAESKVKNIDGAKTDAEMNAINELDARKAFMSDEAKSTLETLDKVSDTAKHPIKAAKAAKASKTAKATNKTTIGEKFNAAKDAIKNPSATTKNAINSLSSKGKAIYEALTDGTKTYNQIVNEFGYTDVVGVIETLAGTKLASESV